MRVVREAEMTDTRRVPELAGWLRKISMAILVFLLVLTVFVIPVLMSPNDIMGQIVQDTLLSLILLSGALAVSNRRILFVPLVLIGVAVIIMRWAAWIFPHDLPLPVRGIAILAALFVLGFVIVVKVFGKGTAIPERIWGAIAVYLLIGLIWAAAYELVSLALPASFAGISSHDEYADRWAWVYFSFSTLTTVGYGDIAPVAHLARSLSNLEALIGQLYPAIVLARLVSLQSPRNESDIKDA
jgi:hypothetical protein